MNDKEGTKGHSGCIQDNKEFMGDYNILKVQASKLALNKTENNPSFLAGRGFCFSKRKERKQLPRIRPTLLQSQAMSKKHNTDLNHLLTAIAAAIANFHTSAGTAIAPHFVIYLAISF